MLSSSPLAIGLLSSSGVPLEALGDWHPAPAGLREVVPQASYWVEKQGEKLAALSLRYSMFRLLNAEKKSPGASTIFAVRSVPELEFNLRALEPVFAQDVGDAVVGNESNQKWNSVTINSAQLGRDEPLFNGVRERLGSWIDFTFTSPESTWVIQRKTTLPEVV